MMLRTVLIALALLAACTPPPASQEHRGEAASPGGAPVAETPDPERDAMTAVLATRVEETLGRPVTFTVTVKRVDGDWGWLVAQPWTPEGAQIDWSQTNLASRAENGAMDSSGTTYALLKRESGAWRVIDYAIAPTDVAWLDWPQRYGAPEALFEMPRQ